MKLHRSLFAPALLGLGFITVALLSVFSLTPLSRPASPAPSIAASPVPVSADQNTGTPAESLSLLSSGAITTSPSFSGIGPFIFTPIPDPAEMSLEELEAKHDALSASVPALAADAKKLKEKYHIQDFAPEMQGCMLMPASSQEGAELEARMMDLYGSIGRLAGEITHTREMLASASSSDEKTATRLSSLQAQLEQEQNKLYRLQAQRSTIKDARQVTMDYSDLKNRYLSDKARLAQVDQRLKLLRAHLEPIPPNRVRDWHYRPELSVCSATPPTPAPQ